MLPRVVTCRAVLLRDISSYHMICSVVRCYQQLLHDVQCSYMLPRVIAFCAVLLRVISSYYVICSVVRCHQPLLHVVQRC